MGGSTRKLAAAAPITDFVQKEPTEGAAPTDAMEVRFVYDDDALYVGARMSTRNAPAIQAPLGRRDNGDQAEHILIWLDTFLDRRTRRDVRRHRLGRAARPVPLERHRRQLRRRLRPGLGGADQRRRGRLDAPSCGFRSRSCGSTARREQIWGLNVRRFRPTLDEEDYWVLIPRTERVFVSRFGDLRGHLGRPADAPDRASALRRRRIDASTATAIRRNPFDDGKNLTSRVGADVKMGLGPNLTLEATVNPDFGQVEADPAEVNLTAFETRFPEQRPFFTRRRAAVQHRPSRTSTTRGGSARGRSDRRPGDFVDYPSDSTILAAGKLTGRLPSKTSVGFISAVTGTKSARVFDLGRARGDRSVRVAPRAYLRASAACSRSSARSGRPSGCSSTAVHRDVSTRAIRSPTCCRERVRRSPATRCCASRAASTSCARRPAARSSTASRGDRAHSSARARTTRSGPTGLRAARPDATSLSGWSMQTHGFERVSGRHWLWGVDLKLDYADLRDQRHRQPERRATASCRPATSATGRRGPGRSSATTRSASTSRTIGPSARDRQSGSAPAVGQRHLGQLLDDVDLASRELSGHRACR